METTIEQILRIPKLTMSVIVEQITDLPPHKLSSSKIIAELMRSVFDQNTLSWSEEFIVLCLNVANRIVGYWSASKGGLTGTIADPRAIFATALTCGATTLVLAHNHPSGATNPSRADRELTEKLKQVGRFHDIAILDHIIITSVCDSYFSFADSGEL